MSAVPASLRRPRVLVSTWRRQGRLWGPVLRDVQGAEVQYVHGVQRAGGRVLLCPQDGAHVDPGELLDGMAGLLLIGGEDLSAPVSGADPGAVGSGASEPRDRWELGLLTAALRADLPVLAICRGLQLLNAALGGTLHGEVADSSPVHPVVPGDPDEAMAYRHRVRFEPGSRLADVYGVPEKPVNSLHHQAVDRLGEGLRVVARADDDGVEAVELPSARWCVGVQWHPELLPQDPLEQTLFAAFVDACDGSRAG